MEASASANMHDQEVPGEPDSDKVYLGAVKSYNDRRGFGFVACAETAAEFGRDVYMAKIEGQIAAAGLPAEGQQKATPGADQTGDKSQPVPRLAEEDLVRFMVKNSLEGYPQAVKVQRLRKFRGSVVQSPASPTREEWRAGSQGQPGRISSPEVAAALGGQGEVLLSREACGQLRLAPGDKVSFCIPEELDSSRATVKTWEAKQVTLVQAHRPSGSLTGCFLLLLPRPVPNGRGNAHSLKLDCHAFGTKVILSGLPTDVGEQELMRFFSKQGATSAIVAHAKGCSFASITFPVAQEVATFLGRCAHAFADDKETRIATLHQHEPTNHSRVQEARLPALPAPKLVPGGEEPGSALVIWAPLPLAVGYVVELRPAGLEAPWAAVNVAGRLGSEGGRFDPACSSCKVSGLREGFSYEARVTYYSSCGCRAEASDASEPCAPRGSAPAPMAPQVQAPAWQTWPEAMQPAPPPGHWPAAAPPAFPQVASQGQVWRCGHGAMVLPPPVPEILPGDEAGFSVAVRWASVGHASAYVVELREAGSQAVERFVRSAVPAAPGSLVELRVGGLRPLPGRTYMAQVRVVSHCGCESQPSAPGWSPPVGGMLPPFDPRNGADMHHMSQGIQQMQHTSFVATGPGSMPPQWSAAPSAAPEGYGQFQGHPLAFSSTAAPQMPAGFAYASTTGHRSSPLPDASPLSVPLPSAPAEAMSAAVQAASAPTVEQMIKATHGSARTEVPMAPPPGSHMAGAPLVPPPDAPPGALKSGRKELFVSHKLGAAPTQRELPPEVTGQEECLILD